MSDKNVFVIAGKNRVAVECLRILLRSNSLPDSQIRVLPVHSDNGEDCWQPSLLKAANDYGVETINVDGLSHFSGRFISIEYDKIIKVNHFAEWDFLNIHFSALPAYKGCWTSVLPILHGARKTGVTLHKMDTGIDTGPIIDQVCFSLSTDVTAESLYERLMDEAVRLFRENMRALISGTWRAEEQELEGSTYFPRKSLNICDTEIDLRQTFIQVDRQVRALFFPIFQTATLNGRPVSHVRVYDRTIDRKPGWIGSENEEATLAQCVDCKVELLHG